jgi:hypothetical protein
MNVLLPQLIQTLREELQQYGEMLARLEQQQDAILHHGPGAVFQSIASIQTQGEILRQARNARELAQRQAAGLLGESLDSTFTQLIPLLPASHQPLVDALVQENNELVQRVRGKAELNQLLLRQSLHLMQHFVDTMQAHSPSAPPPSNPEASTERELQDAAQS